MIRIFYKFSSIFSILFLATFISSVTAQASKLDTIGQKVSYKSETKKPYIVIKNKIDSLYEGESYVFTIKVAGLSEANIEWKVTDITKGEIDSSGIFHAKSSGKVKVIAKDTNSGLASVCTIKIEALEETLVSDLKYSIIEDGVRIDGPGVNKYWQKIKIKNLVIPEIIDGYPVVEIYSGAFAGNENLELVRIPDTVTVIGSSAFARCNKLKTVILSQEIKELKENTFGDCVELTKIVIPDKVKRVDHSVFYNCVNLKSIDFTTEPDFICIDAVNTTPWYKEFPSDFVTVDNYLIGYIGNSKVINIPKGIKKVGQFAFTPHHLYSNIIEINIPEGVSTVFAGAFPDTVEKISIPKSLINLYYYSVNSTKWYKNLINKSNSPFIVINETLVHYEGSSKTVTIPSNVKRIGVEAFSDNTKIEAVIIPEGVERIEQGAFAACFSLKKVTIPKSVNYIGKLSFKWCYKLSNIKLPEGLKAIEKETFLGCPLVKIVIPSTVESIGESAFKQCTSLSSIDIPDSVTTIGQQAFNQCTNLSKITLSKNIIKIHDYSFNNIKNLTIITEKNSYVDKYAKKNKIKVKYK